jgi:co-chaperonin GroES (HSP10)
MIRPLGMRVLIKRLPLPEQSKGGIFILGREWPLCGEVLAKGPKVLDLEVGDLVQFKRRNADEHDHLEGREVEKDTFIINYDHCLCGMRQEPDGWRVWPLADHVLIESDGGELVAV